MRKKIMLILVSLFMIISSTLYVSADDTNDTVNHGSTLIVSRDSETESIKTNNTHRITIDATNANANTKNSKKMRVYLNDPSGKPLTNIEIDGMEEGIMYFPYDDPTINEPIELKDVVVKDANGNVTERYLEFDIIAGASVEMELELFVPGGINGNTNLQVTPKIENSKPNDIVGEPVDVKWTAEFVWTNLTKSVDTPSYARGDDPVLNYTYDVTNKPGIEGNIWEKEIKVVDTLTLPDGLTLPEGYIIDTKNNKITTSAGDDIYSFDFGLKYNPTAADSRNITVSNDRKTITITGVYENPHLDHNDVLENDSNPLKQWHSQLHTDKLDKTTDVTGEIDNKIDATFVPCVDDVEEIEMKKKVETTITDPPATPEPAKNTLTINKYDNYTSNLIDMYKNGITITYEITGLTGLAFKKPANATVTVNDDGTVVILPSDSTSERVVLEAADSNTPASEQFTIPASNKFVTNAPAIVFSQVLESILNNVTIKEFQAPEGYVIPNYYKDKAFKPSKYYSGYYFSFNDDRVAPSPDDNPNQNTIGLYKISGSGNNEILDYEPTNPIQPKELILDVYYGTGESDGMRVKFYHTSNNTFVYDGFFEPGDWGHSIHFTDVNASLIQMKNLPDGEYIVKEYQAPHGYELTYERMSIKVEDGKVYLKPDASNSTEWTEVNYTDGYPDKYLGLKNKRIPTELRIYKVDDNLKAIDEIDENNPVTYSLLNAKGESMLLLKNKKDGKYYYAGAYKEGVLTPITEENPFYPYQPHEGGPYLFEDNKKITSGYLYNPVGGKIEMPCTIYFYASAANREQTPGGPIPQPYALQYQMNCYVPGPNGYHEWTGWIDTKTPTNLLMNKNGGNQVTFEYEVTQDILDANGGVAGNDISVRAKKFPNAPIEQLKQTVKFGYPKVVNLGEDYEIINSSSIVATSNMITIYGLPTTNDYLNGDEYILTEVKAPEGYDKTNEEYLIEIRDSSNYYYRSNYTSQYIENHKTGTEYPEETNHYLYLGKVSGLENGLIDSASFNASGSPKVNPKGLEIVVRDQTDIQNVKQLILADYVSSIGGVATETFEYIGVYDDTDNPNSVHPVTASGNYNLRFKNLPCPSDADTANYFEYSIEEIGAPKGYKINPEKLIFRVYKNYSKFTVVKEGNELTTEVVLPEPTVIDAVTNVSGKKTEYYFNSYYMVINDEEANDPSMVFIEKQDENGKLIDDSQTKFILKDSNGDVITFSDIVHDSADGNIYNLDANSNEAILSANDNGKIAIRNLPKGQYTLVEVEAPHGYTLISTPITITVSGMGDDIKVVVKDPSIGFGSERFASTSYKKIEEIDNSDNAGYSFYVSNEENVQGLKNYITVDDASKNVRYSLFVTNQSKNNFENLVIIDKLPEPGDTGVINLDEYRGSQFTIRLLDEPNFKVYEYDENGIKVNEITNFTVEFSDNTSFTEADFNGVEDSSRWSLVDDLSRSFRIKFADSFKLYTKHTIGVEFDAKMMSDAAPGKIAWNNFGYRYKVGSKILTPEPLKVGVRIKSNNPGNTPKYEAPNTKVN